MQTAEQLIMENDTTINHFKLAYPDRDDGMGIFLLMARLKNKPLRDKVTTMQDKPHNEICKQIKFHPSLWKGSHRTCGNNIQPGSELATFISSLN